MDIVVFVICLAMGCFFTLIGLKNSWLAVISMSFNTVVSADVYVNGLSEVIGHNAGETVTRTFGVDTAILIPMFLAIICALGIFLRWRYN